MGYGLPSYDGPIWRLIRRIAIWFKLIEPELEMREVWDPATRTHYKIHVEPGSPPLIGERKR